MKTIFSEALTRLRSEAGFPTAYRFYHDNGGAPVLKISYRRYLSLEQGRYLPEISKLPRLTVALRLVPKSSGANKLMIAWLRTMAGEETYKSSLEPLFSEGALTSALSPIHKVVKRALAETGQQLTPEQFCAILADRDTYLCFLAVSRDTGLWSAEKLAAALQLKKEPADRALKTLLAAGIIRKTGGKNYICPLASGRVIYPSLNITDSALRAKMESYH